MERAGVRMATRPDGPPLPGRAVGDWPGVEDAGLRRHIVRLVVVIRPGDGLSDMHPNGVRNVERAGVPTRVGDDHRMAHGIGRGSRLRGMATSTAGHHRGREQQCEEPYQMQRHLTEKYTMPAA